MTRLVDRFPGKLAARIVVAAAVIGGGSVLAASPAFAAPSVSAPSSGVAGRSILISGSGWPGFESVNGYLVQGVNQSYFCGMSTNAGGNLGPAACALPTGLPGGAYTLQVKDATTTINKSFTLKPGAHASATSSGAAIGSVAEGQTVYLSGSGFSASSTIKSVLLGATAVTTTPAAPAVSAQGSFSGASFVVPAAFAVGSTTVTVKDSAGKSATFSLTVYAATNTAASSGVSGRNLNVTGTGWPRNDTVYAYLDQGATQTYFCGIATDTTGDLGPVACLLPTSLPQGSYLLSVTDGSVTVNSVFNLNPGAHVSTTASGNPIGSMARGETVFLAGSGFSSGSTITTVKVGTHLVTTSPAAPAVSTQGSFSGASFVVPNTATVGPNTLTVTDSASQSATFVVHVYAATDSAATAGISGRYLTVAGAGWPSYETVYAYLDQGTTQNYVCSLATDGSGNLGPQHCTVPTSLPQGSYILSATDGAIIVNKSFTLNPAAHLGASSSGNPIASAGTGETVYLSGSGFTSNATIKKVTVGGTTVAISPPSPFVSPSGSFTGESLTIPTALPAGATSIVVTDSSNKASTFTVNLFNAVATVPASGAAGSILSVAGTGWPLDETVYAYLIQGTSQSYVCSLATDSSGNLGPAACALPASLPQGTYTLSLTDGAVAVNSPFTLNPAVALTNTSNQPINTAARGSTVNLTGAGFSASSTITSVKIGATVVATTPATPLVNAQGIFNGTSFVVPSGMTVGSYTVTVTDSSGKTGTAPLRVS